MSIIANLRLKIKKKTQKQVTAAFEPYGRLRQVISFYCGGIGQALEPDAASFWHYRSYAAPCIHGGFC